jgi:spore coat polysaccharide biosynthesis protein SpsF
MRISKDIGIIVQARMLSNRLPGKSMMKIGEKPMLRYLLQSLLTVADRNQIIIVTSVDPSNQQIESLGVSMGIKVFRGSEENVASRYKAVLENSKFKYFHRICGDSPYYSAEVLLNPSSEISNSGLNYISTMPNQGYPMGNNIELFSTDFFLKCFEVQGLIDIEHVTSSIYKSDKIRHCKLVGCNIEQFDYSTLKFSVDTQEDFDLAKMVLTEMSFEPWNYTFSEKYQLIKKLKS